jgi:arabinogalactan endo-1,4-beta-galactosidase
MKQMTRNIKLVILLFIFVCCNKEINKPIPMAEIAEFISAVDISGFPEISKAKPVFYDTNGNQKDFLQILKENGINTIRLRLWINPDNEHSGFDEVKQFSLQLKSMGFKIWLSLHYSDTWADPGHQAVSSLWKGISFEAIQDSVYYYTKKVMNEMKPEYIQIGNEINPGFLFPYGHIGSNPQGFLILLDKGVKAVRESSRKTKIIIHYAGIDGSEWFFDFIKNIDYDIIGISYYPIWHGKSLDNLKDKLDYLSKTHRKKMMVAETAYPFTLGWNDWTNNILGSDEHLILPQFPASIDGQASFIRHIRLLINEVDKGIGFCYWGAELIAWKGMQAKDGSPWENQALFDFQNKALPVLKEFKNR